MRVLPWAASAAACLALAHPAAAQTWSPSVNQRMDPPTSQADGYVGVSLGQLIMALGLTLQGVPPQGLEDIRILHPRQTAADPRQTAAVPPSEAHAAAAAEKPIIPAAVKQPDKAP